MGGGGGGVARVTGIYIYILYIILQLPLQGVATIIIMWSILESVCTVCAFRHPSCN